MADVKQALSILGTVIDAAKVAIPAGSAAWGQFNELSEKVRAMQAEERDPTVEEFRELQAVTDSLTDRLEAANRRLNPDG